MSISLSNQHVKVKQRHILCTRKNLETANSSIARYHLLSVHRIPNQRRAHIIFKLKWEVQLCTISRQWYNQRWRYRHRCGNRGSYRSRRRWRRGCRHKGSRNQVGIMGCYGPACRGKRRVCDTRRNWVSPPGALLSRELVE